MTLFRSVSPLDSDRDAARGGFGGPADSCAGCQARRARRRAGRGWRRSSSSIRPRVATAARPPIAGCRRPSRRRANGVANAIALAFHVDYWDRLGWKDRFAAPAWTERQYAMAHANRSRLVYTPQVLVQGHDFRRLARQRSLRLRWRQSRQSRRAPRSLSKRNRSEARSPSRQAPTFPRVQTARTPRSSSRSPTAGSSPTSRRARTRVCA